MEKRYLGDGVYAEAAYSDTLLLTTNNGDQGENTIYLESFVIEALEKFIAVMRAEA